MRRLVIVPLVAGAALISSILATPVFSQSTGPVAADVTAVSPCVSIATSTLTFPSKKFSTDTANSVSTVQGPTVSNCSTVAENILASATGASGTGATWSLVMPPAPALHCASGGSLAGGDKFALNHFVSVGDERMLGLAATTIKTNQAVGAMAGYSFELFMPCTGSSGAGVKMNFTINFTATIP